MDIVPGLPLIVYQPRKVISKRYGFISVDRVEDDEKPAHPPMKRYLKDSFYWYQNVIATNGGCVLDA
ncbi:family 1 glycosylhydrolase [Stecheria sp. CLA-KB-P133]|uniref:Family 1 glycosylhydrolase n=1 Tax=Grylomicrobium aquisgranensis TaxID=2926318 RepID=A0AB35U2M2_9FIRM|nr:family 1 glycosylhydrolase [Stecheria sp. CLA-KB-P133]